MAVPVVKQVVYSTELQKLYCSYVPGMIMVSPVTILQSGCVKHWNTEGVLWLWARYDHGYSPVTVYNKWVVHSSELQKLYCSRVPGMIMVSL